jgi:hypothetical protein
VVLDRGEGQGTGQGGRGVLDREGGQWRGQEVRFQAEGKEGGH